MPCTQAQIETLGHGEHDRASWHFIKLSWPRPRGGIRNATILSMHLQHAKAKRPVAGPRMVASVFAEAFRASHEIDFVTGDFNGARPAGM